MTVEIVNQTAFVLDEMIKTHIEKIADEQDKRYGWHVIRVELLSVSPKGWMELKIYIDRPKHMVLRNYITKVSIDAPEV